MISNHLPSYPHPAYLQLRKNFQQTKTHLSISNLDNPLFNKNPHIFPIFLQRTAKKLRAVPQKLKRITLDLDLARTDPLPLYHLLLKDLKHIEHLKILLSLDLYHLMAYFDILLKTLKKLRNLKVFEVILPIHFESVQKTSIGSLIKILSRSTPKLKDFKLIFQEGSRSLAQLTDKPMLNEWGIQRLARIQSLTLHLPRSAFLTFISENEGKFDISALKRLGRLRILDLGIVDACIPLLSNPKKFIFGHPKGRLFPSLKSFKWNLFNIRSNEIEGLQLLGPELAISFRNPLGDFSVKIKQPGPIKDHEIQIWNQSLASLKTDLRQLYIVSSEGELTDKGSKSLISALSGPKLKRMQVLCLEFLFWKGINDKFVAKLGQVLSHELKYLRLRFEFNQATLHGFAGILQNIFGEGGITDKGLDKLGENLAKKCKNLEFVQLEFGQYEKISDKGVKSLCESLSKIESLKKVWLRFRFCSEASERCGEFVWKKLGPNREVKFALI